MSVLARHQLLDDLAGPAPKQAPARRTMKREPITIGTLMRHRYAGIVFVAGFVLSEFAYFYFRYWG